MTPTISSVGYAAKTTATASNNTASETLSNVSLEKQNDERLRFQTFSSLSIHPSQKRGYKPTPLGGIMLNLTRPRAR